VSPRIVTAKHGKIRKISLEVDCKYIVLGSDGLFDAIDADRELGELLGQFSTFLEMASDADEQLSSELETLGKVQIKKSVKVSLQRGIIVGSAEDLCPELCITAERLCNHATLSKYWSDVSCPADNTSCIIIRVESD